MHLKRRLSKKLKGNSQDDIDELVAGFLMVRTIPRELAIEGNQIVNALSICLVDMASFAYDTGAGEGISTSKDDFAYLDTSDKLKNLSLFVDQALGLQIVREEDLLYTHSKSQTK